MRSFDFAPLYRATVGFDQIADLMTRITAADPGPASNYPPYNIEKTSDDHWRITLAVAGFGDEDLSVELREHALIVTGKKAPEGETPRSFLHRGIATRAFERRFHLADHIRVTGATSQDGLLHIDLAREVPDALKPRQIAIARPDATPRLAN